MEKIVNQFWDKVKEEETALLATSSNGLVTMRTISPVYYENKVLIFTYPNSNKYLQMKDEPHCCLAVGNIFMEAVAEFLGHTMLETNEHLRNVYSKKFNGAFDENMEFGGRNAEFILFKPTKIKGWYFENGDLTGSGIPTIPFEFDAQLS